MTVNHFDVVIVNLLVPTIQYCHVAVPFLLLFCWTVVSNWCFGLDCCPMQILAQEVVLVELRVEHNHCVGIVDH